MANSGSKEWYPTTITGKVVAFVYSLVPPSILCSYWYGVFPASLQIPLICGMGGVFCCAAYYKARGKKLFHHRRKAHKVLTMERGFTLIELLMVISIIGMLAVIVMPSLFGAKNKAYLARAQTEFKTIATALEFYVSDHGGYPPDASRDLPPGLEPYLSGASWPKAPWPNTVYDWDAWTPAELAYNPKVQTYQISVRFCPLGQPNNCTFPKEPWAQGFDYYSAAYYCISGACRSHSARPTTHPGYCINC